MTGRLRLGAVIVALASAPLAGCIDVPQGESALAAPRWLPGYSWTFSTQAELDGSIGTNTILNKQTAQVRLDVLNTTQRFGGEPAYVLNVSEEWTGTPLWNGDRIVVDPHTLATVGWARAGSSDQDCGGLPTAFAYEDDQVFPTLRFPLEAGDQWSGRTGPPGDNLEFVARVLGSESIEVPAGRFDAVHVSLDFTRLADRAPSDDDLNTESMTVDYWYSGDVAYFVKMKMESVWVAEGEPGGATATFTAVLDEFSLNKGPAGHGVSEYATPNTIRPFAVASNAEFPLNVAEADGPIVFGLVEGPSTSGSNVVTVEDVPEYAPPGNPAHRIQWDLENVRTGHRVAGNGPQLTLPSLPGGSYRLTADITQDACPTRHVAIAHAWVQTFWERSWSISIPDGEPRDLQVDTVPVDAPFAYGRMTWTTSAGTPGLQNMERPVLLGPDGQETRLEVRNADAHAYSWAELGNYTFLWRTEGTQAAVGGPTVPYVEAHEVDLTLTLEYH